jgi:hypothetical protein
MTNGKFHKFEVYIEDDMNVPESMAETIMQILAKHQYYCYRKVKVTYKKGRFDKGVTYESSEEDARKAWENISGRMALKRKLSDIEDSIYTNGKLMEEYPEQERGLKISLATLEHLKHDIEESLDKNKQEWDKIRGVDSNERI